MFLQTTTEFDHDFGINLTLHERKKREKTEIKILIVKLLCKIEDDLQYLTIKGVS